MAIILILLLLPVLAYQKIYFDFFSNSQWEKHLAYAYNVNYWDGKGSVEITADMIKLRYANYPKDYFLGVLPSSQYGSVTVLPSLIPSRSSNNLVAFGDSKNPASRLQWSSGTSVALDSTPSGTSPEALIVNTNLSALSIRATEYLQRWKEVVQFSSKDYSDQMAAQLS